MRYRLILILLSMLGWAHSHTERIIYSADGQLPPLTFGAQTCLRIVQGDMILQDEVCVDAADGGAGVVMLRLERGILQVIYRAEPVLGRVSYLIRLEPDWFKAQEGSRLAEAATASPVPAPTPLVADPVRDNTPVSPGTETVPGDKENPGASTAPALPLPPPPNAATAPIVRIRTSVVGNFYLRQSETGTQIAYSLVSRSEVESAAAKIRLFIDDRPVTGRLTRRTTGPKPGHLSPGQAEYGWIVLDTDGGKVLRLEWQIGNTTFKREWRLR